MSLEFNLSERTSNVFELHKEGLDFIVIRATDVKEFIRRLKKKFTMEWAHREIDKLAGDKLK